MSSVHVEEAAAARTRWAAVGAVALGVFALMTSELLPVGLLTPVAAGLGIPPGTAGLMVTVPGLVAALAAPLTVVVAGRRDRRTVLAVLIGLTAVANLASALAPTFAVVLAARVLVGIGIGGFWAIAGSLAPRLLPERHVGRGTAIVFGGVSAASVLGVPLGTFVGDLAGWRTAFAVVAGLAAVALLGLLRLLPPLPATATTTLAGLPRLLRANPAVRVGVAVTALLVTGQFVAYTFVRPVLQHAGIDDAAVSALLLGYGVAGVAGNALAGSRGARDPRRTLLAIACGLGAVLVLTALFGGHPAGAVALLLLWGVAYGGVSVSLQNWMLAAAPRAAEAASSLFVAAFNLSIALGAALGGAVVDASATAVLWSGAAIVLLAVPVLGAARRPVTA